MNAPIVYALRMLLTAWPAAPARDDASGETLVSLAALAATETPAPRAAGRGPVAHTRGPASGVAARMLPDTSRRQVPADTTRRPALTPDPATVPADADDKPTRKTTLLTVLAVAALTVFTLLLYNVRSR